MPFASALTGPVPDGTRAPAPHARHPDHAPSVLDLHRARSLDHTSRTLIAKRDFTIRIVEQRRTHCVDRLVTRMYRSRGYAVDDTAPGRTASGGSAVTLAALRGNTTVGTLSVNVSEGWALNAEVLYEKEIAPYRALGRRVCEFTRLAMQMNESSKEALAALFHAGYIFGHHVLRANDLFIEVHPRHAPFYLRKLGFARVGDERVCPRVDAPALLLHKDLEDGAQELSRLGGLRTPSNRTFYAFMLTPAEESMVLQRLLNPLRLAS